MTSKFNFIFVVCQIGAEPVLKKELAREHPGLKFAYSRPGFLTFKLTEPGMSSEPPLDFHLKSVFARAYGASLGEVKRVELSKIFNWAKELSAAHGSRKLGLHVWQRDLYAPTEEPLGFIPGELVGDLESRIRSEASEFFKISEESVILGDPVLDVIALDPETVWVGAHLHSAFHSPWPGGSPPLVLPPESPSRAFLKLEESLLWSSAPLRAGDTAVEIGSAPGGASFSLLKRGLRVVGIDPGEMHPRLLQNSQFQHICKPVNRVLREELPDSIQWVLLDMNVEPQVSLFAVDRLVSRMKESLLGVLLTLKLNRWDIANEIPTMMEHVREMGMVRLKAAQLSHHRKEIIIYGLTRKGAARKR